MTDIPDDKVVTLRCESPDPEKDPTLLHCRIVREPIIPEGNGDSGPAETASNPEQSGTGTVTKPTPETPAKVDSQQGELITARRVLINGVEHLKILGPDGKPGPAGTATALPQQASPDNTVSGRRFSRMKKAGCPVNLKAKTVQEPGNTSVKPYVKKGGGE